jgi:hypothetical protein
VKFSATIIKPIVASLNKEVLGVKAADQNEREIAKSAKLALTIPNECSLYSLETSVVYIHSKRV